MSAEGVNVVLGIHVRENQKEVIAMHTRASVNAPKMYPPVAKTICVQMESALVNLIKT